MRTIIAGSRGITDRKIVEEAIRASGFTITEVVSGGARGVDSIGECWGRDNSIPVKQFLAKWHVQGKRAGPIRNSEMAEYAEALIAIWDGESRGTLDMIVKAKCKGLQVYVHVVRPSSRAVTSNEREHKGVA